MRYATLLVLVTFATFIALACGGDGSGPSATSTPPSGADATAEAPTPTPGVVTLPIELAPGAVTKVTYASGEEIEGVRSDPTGFPNAAVFFMDTATGEIEGWQVVDADTYSSCGMRENDRFVVCGSGAGENRTAYRIDRESGEIYQWNTNELGLLASWPGGLLFEEASPPGAEPARRFTITDEALQTRSTFDLPGTTVPTFGDSIFQTPLAVLPDESGLALLVARSLYLVDIASGSAQLISEIPETFILTTIQVRPGTEGFSAVLSSIPEKKDGIVAAQTTVVRRYSREGELISEGPPDGTNGRISPDGKLVALQGSLHGEPVLDPGDALHWPVLVVADADTGEPRFRVKGASLCYGDSGPNGLRSGRRWLADSSGILVATKSGFRIVEVAEPALRAAPLSGVDQSISFFEPSPDDPNLFAVGSLESSDLVLVDAQGNSRREVVLAPSAGGLGDSSVWGSSGSEVRFSIPHFGHHGAGGCGVGVTPPPKIEFPPFDDDIHLKVAADGDCLNLRDLPGTTATVVTCLPHDSSVTVTEVDSSEVPGFEAVGPYMISLSRGGGWAHVRTDAGQEGWVSSEFLDWAE